MGCFRIISTRSTRHRYDMVCWLMFVSSCMSVSETTVTGWLDVVK